MQLKLAQRRKIVTLDNQFLPAMQPKDWFDQSLSTGTLSEAKSPLSRELQYWNPITIPYHKWPSSKALFWEHTPSALPHTSPPPLPHKISPEPLVRETDLSFAFYLLSWPPCNKAFYFCKKDLWLCTWSFLCAADKESLPGDDIKSDSDGY